MNDRIHLCNMGSLGHVPGFPPFDRLAGGKMMFDMNVLAKIAEICAIVCEGSVIIIFLAVVVGSICILLQGV